MWYRFGILNHNEFYDFNTNFLKKVAFAQVCVLAPVCLWIVNYVYHRTGNQGLNWLVIFSVLVSLQLVLRRFFFNQMVSQMQVAGVVLSIVNLSIMWIRQSQQKDSEHYSGTLSDLAVSWLLFVMIILSKQTKEKSNISYVTQLKAIMLAQGVVSLTYFMMKRSRASGEEKTKETDEIFLMIVVYLLIIGSSLLLYKFLHMIGNQLDKPLHYFSLNCLTPICFTALNVFLLK